MLKKVYPSQTNDIITIEDISNPDLGATITENLLLKVINKEIKHKNELLLETIKLMKTNKPTYAEISYKKSIKKQEKIPEIRVTNKSQNVTNDDALQNIHKILQKDIVIPFEKVIDTKKMEQSSNV